MADLKTKKEFSHRPIWQRTAFCQSSNRRMTRTRGRGKERRQSSVTDRRADKAVGEGRIKLQNSCSQDTGGDHVTNRSGKND